MTAELPVRDEVPALNPGFPTADLAAGVRLFARLARRADQACQSIGISLPQYRLLVAASGRALRARELATESGISRPTLTSLVDGLESAGLLRRVPVANDRRGILLEVTESGRIALLLAENVLANELYQLMDPGAVHLVTQLVSRLASVREEEGGPALAG